jgi:hypothetical protein
MPRRAEPAMPRLAPPGRASPRLACDAEPIVAGPSRAKPAVRVRAKSGRVAPCDACVVALVVVLGKFECAPSHARAHFRVWTSFPDPDLRSNPSHQVGSVGR